MLDDLSFILAQVAGGIVVLIGIVHALQKSRKGVLITNALGNVFCVLQYLFLGAYTGIVCCIIAILRNIVFSGFKKKVPIWVYLLFVMMLIAANIPFIQSFVDVLPILNVIVYSTAIRQEKIHKIKAALIFTGTSGITFDVFKQAYVGLILNAIDLTGGIVGVVIYLKTKRKHRSRRRK